MTSDNRMFIEAFEGPLGRSEVHEIVGKDATGIEQVTYEITFNGQQQHVQSMGEASILAAQAASCAQDQGKFWEYHDSLFGNVGALAFTSSRLKRYAADLGLDERTFGACLDSKKHAELVDAETAIGRALGASGSPAFLLNGRLIIGAYPFEVFQQALDGILAGPARPPSGQTK